MISLFFVVTELGEPILDNGDVDIDVEEISGKQFWLLDKLSILKFILNVFRYNNFYCY